MWRNNTIKYEIRNVKSEMYDQNDPEENLQRRTKRFSVVIVKYVESLPPTYIAREIGRQLLRSGMSVGSNTRAAYRGRSKKEFVAKLGVVVEEADESAFWLEVILESNIRDDEKTRELLKEANELVSIFVSIIKKNK